MAATHTTSERQVSVQVAAEVVDSFILLRHTCQLETSASLPERGALMHRAEAIHQSPGAGEVAPVMAMAATAHQQLWITPTIMPPTVSLAPYSRLKWTHNI